MGWVGEGVRERVTPGAELSYLLNRLPSPDYCLHKGTEAHIYELVLTYRGFRTFIQTYAIWMTGHINFQYITQKMCSRVCMKTQVVTFTTELKIFKYVKNILNKNFQSPRP